MRLRTFIIRHPFKTFGFIWLKCWLWIQLNQKSLPDFLEWYRSACARAAEVRYFKYGIRSISTGQLGNLISVLPGPRSRRSSCLVNALTCKFLMHQYGIGSGKILIGVKGKDQKQFHAWLEFNEQIIIGAQKGLEDYKILHNIE